MSRFARLCVTSLAVLSVVVMLQGCVSRAKYRELEDQYNLVNAKRIAAEEALANMKPADLAAMEAEREALLKRIAEGEDALKAREAELKLAIDKLEQERSSVSAENAKLKAELEKMGFTDVTIVDGMVKFDLSSDLLFNLGSATLKADEQKMLEKLATVLVAQADRVRIDGHTDTNPVVKTKPLYKDNWGLSCERALTVARFLMEHGVKGAMMSVAGYGEFRPVEPNTTKEGQRKNRRVEVFIKPKMASEQQPVTGS